MVAADAEKIVKKKAKKVKSFSVEADAGALMKEKKMKKQKSTDTETETKKKKRKAESLAPADTPSEPVKKKKMKKVEPESKGPSPAASDSADSEQCALEISDSKPADPLALDNFRLSPAVKALLREKGIESLFSIQAQTLTSVLDGFDLVGRARYALGHTLLASAACCAPCSSLWLPLQQIRRAP